MPIFSDEELKRLTMPTLLFVGEKDALLHSAMTAKRLEKLLPDVTINILPNAGHVLINLQDKISSFLTTGQLVKGWNKNCVKIRSGSP